MDSDRLQVVTSILFIPVYKTGVPVLIRILLH